MTDNSDKIYTILCKKCRKEFHSKRKDAKYCSEHTTKRKIIYKIPCAVCRKLFETKIPNRKYCDKHRPIHNKTIKYNKVCPICNKSFTGFFLQVYCSRSCAKKASWNRSNNSIDAKVWVTLVEQRMEECGYKCMDCEAVGVKLIGHHNVPVSFGGKNEKENVDIVCDPCHAKRHIEIQKLICEAL